MTSDSTDDLIPKSKTPLYVVWVNLKHRQKYSFTRDWYNWEIFKNDVSIGYQEGMSLLPIDSDKPLGRDNFKWVMKRSKPVNLEVSVVQIHPENLSMVKIWGSIREASDTLEIPLHYISRVCRGGYKTCRGYGWSFVASLSGKRKP